MQLKKISCKNFLSYKEVSLDIEPNTIYGVIGENKDTSFANSNGAGKSALFDIVMYALYGYSTRGTISNLVGPFGKEGEASVVLEKDDKKIKVVRTCGRHSKLEVYVNDKKVSTPYVTDTQTLLNSLLKISYSSFLLSSYISADSAKKFGAATSTEKKRILDEILQMDFEVYHKYIRNKIKDVNEKIASLSVKKQTIFNEITWIDNLLMSIDDKQKVSEEAMKSAREELNSAEKQYNQLLKEKEPLEKEITTINVHSVKIAEKESFIKKRIELLEKKQSCPTCLRKITDETREKIIPVLLNKLSIILKEKEKVEKKKEDIDKKIKEISKKLESVKTLYEEKKANLTILETEKNKSTENKDVLIQRKTIKEKEYEKIVLELTSLQENLHLYEFWKDAFSSSGVKVLLQSSIVEFVNKRLSIYTSMIFNSEVDIKLVLDGTKLLFVIEKDGKEFIYEQLSGGERRRCDVAFLLSLRDAFAATTQIQFAFLDEIFDVLDREGKERIIEVLKNQKNCTYFIVTQDENLQQSFKNIITIVKEKGVSNGKVSVA